jgi:hypothetical protein
VKSFRRVALALVVAALAACSSPQPSVPPGASLTLLLTAGPVCPVEQVPPDPACAPRPAAGQVVAILDREREVARGTSDADGRIDFALPAGRYTVRAVAAAGFPAPPADQIVDVAAGAPMELTLDYDTGIR